MKYLVSLLAISTLMMIPKIANADMYSCAKMTYKDGWLTKYEYLGNTWGANTKKHGAVSSSVGSSIENTTSSVDPGAYTGKFTSSVQFVSSWGECSILDYYITKKHREDYIDQNIHEIKKQVAMGAGHHIDSLAFISGCRGISKETWSRSLQQRTAALYDAENGAAFASELNSIVSGNDELKSNCQIL